MSSEPNRVPWYQKATHHKESTRSRTRTEPLSPPGGIVGWARAGLRITWISLWTGGMLLIWGTVWSCIFYIREWCMKWRHTVFQTWATVFLKIIGGRVTLRGTVPEPPFFMVSNHLSHLDIPVLASLFETTFVAKQEVEDWTLIGLLTHIVDTIFIDRDDCYDIPRVNDKISKQLELGDGIIVFPEATSTNGDKIRTFNSPLLEVPAQSGRSVDYVHLQYSTPSGVIPAKHSICFWGDMEFRSHFLKMLTLPEFSVTVTIGSAPLTGNCRKSLARRLTSAVRNLHTTHPQNRLAVSRSNHKHVSRHYYFYHR